MGCLSSKLKTNSLGNTLNSTATLARTAAKAAVPAEQRWAQLKKLLIVGKTVEQLAARRALFDKYDGGSCGFLTKGEADAGCRDVLNMDAMTDYRTHVSNKAYDAACEASRRNGGGGSRMERPQFRLYIQYLYDYFELFVLFGAVDTKTDPKVTLEQFQKAVPTLESWGVPVNKGNPQATFREITGGADTVPFQSFVGWVFDKQIDNDGDVNSE